ncbi:LOW QUALITY PROTEIN: hypothetical protein HID58_075361, partial [Brassica napus]
FVKPVSRHPSLNLRVTPSWPSHNIASSFLCIWDSLNFKKDMEFVGITVLFLDEKVSDLTKETTRVVIRLLIDPSSNLRPGVRYIASGFFFFWDSLNFKKDREFVGITVLFLDEKVNVVGKIRYVQGTDLTKETNRVVIRLLVAP